MILSGTRSLSGGMFIVSEFSDAFDVTDIRRGMLCFVAEALVLYCTRVECYGAMIFR